jgi:peptide-methionine (S)-S-oxide reductase
VEARFGVLRGVVRTRVGYAGGRHPYPTYKNLGDHTETVQVDYDPRQISYDELLEVFWASHNPGILPWSRQYLNVIFYENDEQRRKAESTRARLAAASGKPVFSAILPATSFTLAEDYHQKYYLRQVPELLEEMRRYYPSLSGLVNSTVAARLNGYLAGFGTSTQLEAELPLLGLSTQAQEILRVRLKGASAGQSCPLTK